MTPARRITPKLGVSAAVLGSVGVVVGAARPWLRTGAVTRSAYALARSARNLGLLDSGPRRAAITLLFLTPMLCGAVVLLFSLGRRRGAALVAATIGAFGVAAGCVGRALPGNGDTPTGVWLTIGSGAVALGGSLTVLVAPLVRRVSRDASLSEAND